MIPPQFDCKKETAQVVIRPLTTNDYEVWLEGFSNRLEAQYQYDDGKLDMSACTEQWFQQLVAHHQQLAYADDTYIFAIFNQLDGSHLGMVDFSTLAREPFQWGRIGYTIHNQYWRKGYGKEAVRAALAIAFEQLQFHRIEAHINLDNIPSIKLVESVGMTYECTRKGFIFEHNEWTDHLIYYINAQ